MSKVICMYSGRDGQSHFAEAPLQLASDKPGRLTTGLVGARGWMVGESTEARFVDWHTSGPGGVSVMLRGYMDVEVGSGERRRIAPGDLFVALDTSGQGHRTWMSAGSQGLTVALDGDPEALMLSLFGRKFDAARP